MKQVHGDQVNLSSGSKGETQKFQTVSVVKYSLMSTCQFYNFVSGCQNIGIPLMAAALYFPKIFETKAQSS